MISRPRITAVADSDSYLKFACATLDALGPSWDRRVLLVRSPLLPTAGQTQAATAGTFMEGLTPQTVPSHRLNAETDGSDVVLAAATGPVVREVFARIAAHRPGQRRPALVSGLPGVAYPATERALEHRALGDAFIVHSHAESRAFSDLAAAMGRETLVLLSHLPFLSRGRVPAPSPGTAPAADPAPTAAPVRRVVFAAQAKMPFARAEREHVLLRLAATAAAHPGTDVVVKLRARAGEPQTHLEAHPYDVLWRDLAAAGRVDPGAVRFATGSMAAILEPGSALVTVSSTAVLEALDRGLPGLVLSDFGVSRELLNGVFAGSGLLGTFDDVARLRFAPPDPVWLRENYFHPQHVELGDLLAQLAARSRAGELRTDPAVLRHARTQLARTRLRTALPTPLLRVVRATVRRRRPQTGAAGAHPGRRPQFH